MKKSIISRGLYKDGLRKNLITFLVGLVVVLAYTLIIPLIAIQERFTVPFNFAEAFTAFGLISYIFTLVAMFVVFNNFNRRNASDFYLSLPYTRTCLALTNALSVFTYVVILDAVALGSQGIVYLVGKSHFILQSGLIANNLIGSLISSLFFIGILLIGISLAGNILGNVVISLIVGLAPRIILCMVKVAATASNTLLQNPNFLAFLNTDFNTFFGALLSTGRNFLFLPFLFDVTHSGWSANVWYQFLYTFILAGVAIVVGVVLFNRRPSEIAAGFSVSNKTHILLATVVATLICTLGIRDMKVHNFPYFIVAGIVVFLVYCAIFTKGGKKFAKTLPFLAVVVVVTGGAYLCAVTADKKASNFEFKSDEIEYVMYTDGNVGTAQFYTDDLFNTQQLKSKDTFKAVIDAMQNQKKEGFHSTNFYSLGDEPNCKQYMLKIATKKDGIKYRSVIFNEEGQTKLRKALSTETEFKKAYCTLPDDLYITDISITTNYHGNIEALNVDDGLRNISREQSKVVKDALQKEINKMGFEKWYEYFSHMNDGVYYSDDSANLTFVNNKTGATSYINLYKQIAPDTMNKIMSMVYDSNKPLLDAVADGFKTFKTAKVPSYAQPYMNSKTEQSTYIGNVRIVARTKDGKAVSRIYDQMSTQQREKVFDLAKELIRYSQKFSTVPTISKYVYIYVDFPEDSGLSFDDQSAYTAGSSSVSLLLPFPEKFDMTRFDEYLTNDELVDDVIGELGDEPATQIMMPIH